MIRPEAAVAVAFAELVYGRKYSGGVRAWGSRGRLLSKLMGARSGERGGIFINRTLVSEALTFVRERGWSLLVNIAAGNPAILYPLNETIVERLVERLPEGTAEKLIEMYLERWPNSRLARLYKKLLRAKRTQRHSGIESAEDKPLNEKMAAPASPSPVDTGPPPEEVYSDEMLDDSDADIIDYGDGSAVEMLEEVLARFGATLDNAAELVSYRCGVTFDEAYRLLEEHAEKLAYSLQDIRDPYDAAAAIINTVCTRVED